MWELQSGLSSVWLRKVRSMTMPVDVEVATGFEDSIGRYAEPIQTSACHSKAILADKLHTNIVLAGYTLLCCGQMLVCDLVNGRRRWACNFGHHQS